LVVPLGRLSVTLPDESVAAVNGPEPIWVATAVGVVPAMVKVTVVGVPPPPPPPPLPEPPELPPQPASKGNTKARAEIRKSAQDMKNPSPNLRLVPI